MEPILAILNSSPVGTITNFAQPVEKHGADDFSGYGLSHVTAAVMAQAILDDANEEAPQELTFFINSKDSAAIAGVDTQELFNRKFKLAANYWVPKRTLQIVSSCRYSTTGNPNATHRLKNGSGTLFNYGNNPMGNNKTNAQLYTSATLKCISAGINGQLQIVLDEGRIDTTPISLPAAVVSVDTTQEMVVRHSHQWQTASALNTIVQEKLQAKLLG